MKKEFLKRILSSHFIKFSLVPILIVEVTLVVLYFSINKYIASKNSSLMINEAKSYSQNLLKNEADLISDKLVEVSRNALFLQKEHEALFANPSNFSLPNGTPIFNVAPNGVFYKTNEIGSSLYYSSHTKITEKERKKAIFTEAMDVSLKNIVDINPLIIAAYFNSWDDLNRLYPFIPKVYEQYGEHIHMEDYNFYYLADEKHNPQKKHSWTSAYLDPAGNGWMLSCLVPIYKNNFLEGVTGLDITIDTFVKNVLNTQLPYNAKLFMVDGDGMIIAMPEKIEELLGLKELKQHLYTDVLLKTIEKPEEYNILKNQSPFASHFKQLMLDGKTAELNIKGDEYITLMQNVNETNWKMMVLIEKKEIFNEIERLQELTNKIGYLAIILLLIFYVIFFYVLLKRINHFSSKITKPIVDLSEQTELMTKKDTTFKAIDTNINEISKLSDNFNFMINELKKQAKRLRDAKELAENANKSKDEFLANISHELKTPLNSINVISSVMYKNKNQHLDDKEVKNLEIINKCGNDLMHIISDILDFSKINAGKLLINYQKVDVKKMISSIVDSFESQISEKSLNFSVKIDDTINLIYSDENRISQIVKNLLSNAVKFTPENKKIEISVVNLEENIKIIIKDEGIGIPQDKLLTIFDRFIQVDATTSRKYGGTGLGLTICKELVHLLKGEISVSSSENIGSTFEVILPKNSAGIVHNVEEKIEEEKDSLFVEESVKKESTNKKESIIILNTKPIEFMHIIIELKKSYIVKQALSLAQLDNLLKVENYDKVIVDLTTLSQSDIGLIKEKSLDNLILIYENEIDEEFAKLAKQTIVKSKFLKSGF